MPDDTQTNLINDQDLIVEIYHGNGLCFVTGVNGHVTLCQIEDIEKDAQYIKFEKEDEDCYILFKASWFEGQFDHEYRCEFPPYWELDKIRSRKAEHIE